MLPILNTPTSRRHAAQVRDLLRAHGLSPWHLHAARVKSSWQPYHNYQHSYKVAINAVAAAVDAGIAKEHVRRVLLAGLYHDYDHAADFRNHDDQVNIRRALRGAGYWLRLLHHGITAEDRRVALALIALTENTHSQKSDLPGVGALRDADLLATTGDDDDALWRQGLATELNIAVTPASTLQFLAAHAWQTAWGQAAYDAILRGSQAAEGDER